MIDSAIFPDMGNNLKSLRETAKMTQEAAADAMGVSKGQFIKLERGERRLTMEYITRAAKAFEVSVSQVIDDAEADNYQSSLKLPKHPDLAVRLADMFAKVMRLSPDRQGQIADIIEGELKRSQAKSRDTTTKQVS